MVKWLMRLGLVLLGLILGFLINVPYQRYVQMQANVNGLVQIVNYNLQQGRLVAPSAPAPVPEAPAPPGH